MNLKGDHYLSHVLLWPLPKKIKVFLFHPLLYFNIYTNDNTWVHLKIIHLSLHFPLSLLTLKKIIVVCHTSHKYFDSLSHYIGQFGEIHKDRCYLEITYLSIYFSICIYIHMITQSFE